MICQVKCVPENARKGEFSVKMSGGMKGHWAVWKVFQEFYRMKVVLSKNKICTYVLKLLHACLYLKGGDVHSSVPLHKLSSSFSLPVENGLPPKKVRAICTPHS